MVEINLYLNKSKYVFDTKINRINFRVILTLKIIGTEFFA